MEREKNFITAMGVRLLTAEVMVAMPGKGSVKILMGLDGKSLTSLTLASTGI